MRRLLPLATATALLLGGAAALASPAAADAPATHPVFGCGSHPGELNARSPVDGPSRNLGGRCEA